MQWIESNPSSSVYLILIKTVVSHCFSYSPFLFLSLSLFLSLAFSLFLFLSVLFSLSPSLSISLSLFLFLSLAFSLPLSLSLSLFLFLSFSISQWDTYPIWGCGLTKNCGHVDDFPPRGVSYLLCPLIKNPEEEDPPRRICMGGPFPPGSWLENIVDRKPSRGGGFLSIEVIKATSIKPSSKDTKVLFQVIKATSIKESLQSDAPVMLLVTNLRHSDKCSRTWQVFFKS